MEKNLNLVVIIPIYKDSFNEYEQFTFEHNIEILSERYIVLIGPQELTQHLNHLVKKIKKGSVKLYENKYFGAIRNNTRLLMSKSFYEDYVAYDYMLMCHFDAYIFKDDLDFWMDQGFDNIGSPLFYKNNNSIHDLRPGMNGGFCLRNIKSCIKVLSFGGNISANYMTLWNMEKYFTWKVFRIFRDGLIFNFKNSSNLRPILNEDMYWSLIVPDKYNWFKCAKFEDAIFFSFERNARLLYKINNKTYPMGMHAWWKYDEVFAKELIANFNFLNKKD